MNNGILVPGAGILFMKVGTHAQETIEEIIERKSKEIESAGFALWGYGGNTCHPRTMVQPFAQEHEERKQPIYLCMEKMISNHWGEPVIAKEFSADGVDWTEIPDPIEVKGSRFALKITNLRRESFHLPLDATRVAVGLNKGRLGSRYVNGRVDKACLNVSDRPERLNAEDKKEIAIDLVADIQAPYAYFLRGNRKE